MAQGLKLLFVLLLVACLGSGSAAHISLSSLHKETSLLTPKLGDPCMPNPCGQGSTCEPRFGSSFVCLCLAGDWYDRDSRSCTKGKIFPGQLIMSNLTYKEDFNDPTSALFQDWSNVIYQLINLAFNGSDGFIGSTDVLKLEQFKPESTVSSREVVGVSATVDIVFHTVAVITTEEVKEKIDSLSCSNCTELGISFVSGDLCKKDRRYPCDTVTTASCSSVNGSFTCSCREGYLPTDFSERTCIDPCEGNPCGQGSTCEPRFGPSYVCLCLAGDWYDHDSRSCTKGKIFPGQLIMSNLIYEEDFNDPTSALFQDCSVLTYLLINLAFNGSDGFIGPTDVLKLEQFKPESSVSSRDVVGVSATVDIVFHTRSVITTEEVKEKIDSLSCSNCTELGISFISGDLCKKDSRYPCDTTTTTSCSSKDGSYTCFCGEGYNPTEISDRTCIEEGAKTTPTQPTTTPDNSTYPCEGNRCGQGSTCEPRFGPNYVCLCLAGDFYNYNSASCTKGKIFPGQLIMSNLTYKEDFNDPTSALFRDWSNVIYQLINLALSDYDGFIRPMDVLNFKKFKPESSVSSREEVGVSATVNIAFHTVAVITTEEVKEKIDSLSCSICTELGISFISGDLCKKDHRYPCDTATESCSSVNGSYTCNCLDGYIPTHNNDRSCIACPSGQKAVDSECVNCPFGYSGFNCNESWPLSLIITGSVLAVLLLIVLILLPIVAFICSKKSSKKNKIADMGNPNLSHSAAEAPFVNRGLANSQTAAVNRSADAFSDAGVPSGPRVTTEISWDRTNLEMTPRNDRQNLNPVGRNSRLYRDEDDVAPYARNPDRPHNNPYAQKLPQINPYASRQGQSNPRYINDD